MALAIETFSNSSGGNSAFKAIGHPLAMPAAQALLARLRQARSVALYDPHGHAQTFAAIYPLDGVTLSHLYVQEVAKIGTTVLGLAARPVTRLAESGADLVFVATFDAERPISHIQHLLPEGAQVVSLDMLRLPDALVSDPGAYLSGINFSTNFAFFRDAEGQHTRLVTANYWSGYGAQAPLLYARLFGQGGETLAEWQDPLPPVGGTIAIDSRAVRQRFGLGEFTGQLFVQVARAAGHDIVKYALDTYGDGASELSCTHDANAWPSDRFAGLPAPREDERVILWVQNSHPAPIPPGGIGLSVMGSDQVVPYAKEVPPFATVALDVATLLPDLCWPAQIEIHAGKHLVRPRYEVLRTDTGRWRIAHPNVERGDLKPDPRLPELGDLLGKGFLLTAPVLPADRFRTIVLPTPMATSQQTLPLLLTVYDASGRAVGEHRFGALPRGHRVAFEVNELARPLANRPGHLELSYDFTAGREADGWLHALFRMEDRLSGHVAETSFGSHIFNTVLTHGSEPQSYSGKAPGLSTRLFLRMAPQGDVDVDTFCHLIYPASTSWHPVSDTQLILTRADGTEVARSHLGIPCGGSVHLRVSTSFTAAERKAAGENAHIVIRDTTCRLFGYHGLIRDGAGGAFALDHMFGF